MGAPISEGGMILHGGALGDLVLTLQLALRLPGFGDQADMDVVARIDPGDLSAMRPSIRRRSSEGLGLHWLYGDHDDPPATPLKDLIAGRRVLSALGGTHTIVHQRLLELRPAEVWSIDPRPQADAGRHITEQWQTQLERQGLLVPKCVHQRHGQRGLGVPEAVRARGRRLLADAAGSEAVILLHPGSGGRRKCWPVAMFRALVDELDRATDARVAILLGPVEVETWDAEMTASFDDVPTIRNPAPDELVQLLAAARALVGNDAGPSHLAALLGTPTVTLFGPTSAAVWRPLGPRAQTLRGDAGHADWGLTPAAVAEAVSAALH
jgi:heptosyltransferase-3